MRRPCRVLIGLSGSIRQRNLFFGVLRILPGQLVPAYSLPVPLRSIRPRLFQIQRVSRRSMRLLMVSGSATNASLAFVSGAISTFPLTSTFPLWRKSPNPERIPPSANSNAQRHHGSFSFSTCTFLTCKPLASRGSVPAVYLARFRGGAFPRLSHAGATVVNVICMASRTSIMVCSARAAARSEPASRISMACFSVVAARRCWMGSRIFTSDRRPSLYIRCSRFPPSGSPHRLWPLSRARRRLCADRRRGTCRDRLDRCGGRARGR